MSLFSDLVQRELGDIAVEAKNKLIDALEDGAADFAIPKVADGASRIVLKSLDGVVATAVKALPIEEAERLAAGYLADVLDELGEFSLALEAYLPHQVAVEAAKKVYGSKSPEAEVARAARAAFIEETKSELRDVFRAVAGKEPQD